MLILWLYCPRAPNSWLNDLTIHCRLVESLNRCNLSHGANRLLNFRSIPRHPEAVILVIQEWIRFREVVESLGPPDLVRWWLPVTLLLDASLLFS